MALTKEISHDCQACEDGQLQVREITRIMEDGVEISKTYHRHIVDVGDDVSGQPQFVQDLASNFHTPARISARAAVKNAQNV